MNKLAAKNWQERAVNLMRSIDRDRLENHRNLAVAQAEIQEHERETEVFKKKLSSIFSSSLLLLVLWSANAHALQLPGPQGPGIAPGAGAIVNADVNASAAIAGTKISPAFGSQNITNTGNITATGGTVTATTFAGSGASLTALNASNLSSGTVPTAQFPGGAFNGASELIQLTAATKYPALDGSLITNLSGAPSGAAGGDLTGTYPNPTIASTCSGTPTFTTFIGAGTATSSSDPLGLNLTQLFAVKSGTAIYGYNNNSGQPILGITDGTIRGFVGHINVADGVTVGAYTSDRFTIRTANTARLFIDAAGGTNLNGLMTTYNSITTVGNGIPAIYGTGRTNGATAAVASVATYTVGAADGSFIVSCNVLVTTATTHAFTVTCAYTDEGNTSRVATFALNNLAGTALTSIINTTVNGCSVD